MFGWLIKVQFSKGPPTIKDLNAYGIGAQDFLRILRTREKVILTHHCNMEQLDCFRNSTGSPC